MTQIARQPGLVYEREDEAQPAPVSKYARARALAAQTAPVAPAPSKYAAARALAAQTGPSSPGVAATITQPGGMPSTTASQLQRPASLENLGSTIGDAAQAGSEFIQSAPYGMMKDSYDAAAGLAARVANVPMVGRAMEAVGLRPDLANDTSGYEPDVRPPDTIPGQLGRGVGSVGSVFAATALTGGAPVVLPLVAGAQSLGATYQAARQRALEMGANDQQAHQIAAAEADTMGLVSTVTSLPVGKALSGIAPQALSRAVATANRGGQLGQLVRTAVAEGSQEAMEEASQMILQRVAEDDPAAFQDWQKRIAISAGAGAIGGGVIAGVQAVGSQQGQRQAPQDYPAQRDALAALSPQNAQQFAQPIPRGEKAGPEASVEAVEQGWPSFTAADVANRHAADLQPPTPDRTNVRPRPESASPDESLSLAGLPQSDSETSRQAASVVQGEVSLPSALSSLTIAELKALDLERGGTGKGTKVGILRRLQQPLQPTRPTGSESASPEQSQPPAGQSQSLSPVPSQPPASSVAKQPWEMTREEYVGEYNEPYSVSQIQQAEKSAKGRRERHNRQTGAMVPPSIRGEVEGKLNSADASVDEMRRAYREYVDSYKQRASEHYEAVDAARKAGKPVPPEVLADYPDLSAKATTPPQPSREFAGKPFTAYSSGYKRDILFTPSSKGDGGWQVTRFDKDGRPSGDTLYKSWDEAVRIESRYGLDMTTARKPGTDAKPQEETSTDADPDDIIAQITEKVGRGSGEYAPEIVRAYQQAGSLLVSGVRLQDAETVGRMYHGLDKGILTLAEYTAFVDDLRKSGKVSPPQPSRTEAAPKPQVSREEAAANPPAPAKVSINDVYKDKSDGTLYFVDTIKDDGSFFLTSKSGGGVVIKKSDLPSFESEYERAYPKPKDNPAYQFAFRTPPWNVTKEEMAANEDQGVAPNNPTPDNRPLPPIGTYAVDKYGGWVMRLEMVDPNELILTEDAKDGRRHPLFGKYVQWAKEGKRSPIYVSRSQSESQKGKLVSSNRRRVLAAIDAGLNEIPAWVDVAGPDGTALKHEQWIELAVEEGYEIPDAVLAEYPRLAKKYAEDDHDPLVPPPPKTNQAPSVAPDVVAPSEAMRVADKVAKAMTQQQAASGFAVSPEGFSAAWMNLEDADKVAAARELANRGLIPQTYKNRRTPESASKITDAVAKTLREMHSVAKENRTEAFSESEAYKKAMGESAPVAPDVGRAEGAPRGAVEGVAGVGASSALKKRGLKGDALANVMDRIGELRDNGAQVGDDGYVTLYHRTTPEKADAIRKSGMMRGEEDGLFFSTSRTGQADGFGDAIVVVREPVERIELDDVFGNEAHVRIPLKRAGQSVKVGVVAEPTSSAATGTNGAPADLAALRAKYPAVSFTMSKGTIIPSTLKGKALAEWRNTASGVPFKDQIAKLDALLARQSGSKTQAAPKPTATEKAMRDGTKKGYTFRDVQKRIREIWRDKGFDAAEEADAVEATGNPDSFSFGGKVPADLLERLDEEAARRLVRGNVKGGMGEETLARLGADGMAQKVREAYQGEFKTAETKLRDFIGKHGDKDPEGALWLAIYDKWPDKGSEVPMTTLDPKKVKAGTTFTINGHKIEIRPHTDGGFLVLKDGEDYPVTPVDALDKIPVDKGSVKQDGPTTAIDAEIGKPAGKDGETTEEAEQPAETTEARAVRYKAENGPKVAALQKALASGKTFGLSTYSHFFPLTKPEHIKLSSGGSVMMAQRKGFVTLFPDQVNQLLVRAGIDPETLGAPKTYTSEKLSGERVQNLAGEDIPLTTGRAKSLFGAPVPKAEGDGNGWRIDDRIIIGEIHSKDKPSQGRWKVVGIDGSGPDARITMEKVGGTRRQTLPAYGLEGWGIVPMTAEERLNAADSLAFDAMSPEEKAAKYPGIQRGESLDSYNRRSGKNDTPEMFGGAGGDSDGPLGIPFRAPRESIVDRMNRIADEARTRRKNRRLPSSMPGFRSGGSPLIPDAIDFGIEIAARAVAKGITGGQALTKHISATLKTLPEELKPYGGRVRYVARRVVLGATKNGVFQPSLMADSIQTERLRHAENDETVKARKKLHKIVGGTEKAKAEPKLRQEIDENLGVRKAPTYTVGGPVDLESLLPEHRYAIATLYTSVKRGKAISGTNEAAEFINAQNEKGLANLFTPEMLAELRGLEGRGAKGGMTPDQMELIATAIQHVAHLSKTQRSATVLGQIRQLDEDGATVVGELTGRVNVPKQGLIDRAMGRAEKEPSPGIVRRFLVRAQDSLGDMLHVAFGDGVMKKYGYEAIAKAEGAKRLEYIKADAKLREVLTRHKIKAEDVGKAVKNSTTFNLPNAGEVKIPAMEALDIVLMAGDQQNTAKLVKNGVLPKRFKGQVEKKIDITEADIEALGQQLPKWLMDFGRTSVEIINGYTDQVNETSVKIDGVEIAEKRTGSDYYYPRSPDDVLRTAGVRQDEAMELAWAERLGFTKKRTGSSVPYQIRPAIERIMDHIDGVTTYIHMAEPTLNVRKLIARPEVLENIQKRLGSGWRDTLLRHLSESQGMVPPAKSNIQGAGRWLLRNTARTALWGRLSSAMAQTAGVPMLMNRMTGKERAHMLKHLAKLDWVKNPTVMREMTDGSGYFADRYPEVGEQTRLGTGIDLESSLPTTPMGRWYQEALRVGFKPMEYGDKVLSALAYMAAKDAGHPDPVFRAEMLIRQSQNATSPMDRSGMMLEGEKNALVGALALFSSAPNRVRGQIRADLSDVRANPKSGKAWARLAGTVIAAGIAAAIGESIRELWRRQKVGFSPEDKPRSAVDHLVNSLATLGDSIVPKGGQLLRATINGLRGKVSQTFDSPGMDLADSLGTMLGHLDADEEKAKRLGPNIDRALRALSSFTGVVGEPVYDLGVGIYRTFNPPATIAAYSEAIRAGNYEEARRIAAELRKANPKIDLKARRKNYEERVGVREKK